MNNIDTQLTQEDTRLSSGQSAATIASGILDMLKVSAPYNSTFLFMEPELQEAGIALRQDQCPILERVMQRQFETWANSWIAPLCRQIIAKSQP